MVGKAGAGSKERVEARARRQRAVWGVLVLIALEAGVPGVRAASAAAPNPEADATPEARGRRWAQTLLALPTTAPGGPGRTVSGAAEDSAVVAWRAARERGDEFVRLALPVPFGEDETAARFERAAAAEFSRARLLVLRPWDQPLQAVIVRWRMRSRVQAGLYEECGVASTEQLLNGTGPMSFGSCQEGGLRDGRPVPDLARPLAVEPRAGFLGDEIKRSRPKSGGWRAAERLLGNGPAAAGGGVGAFEAWMAMPDGPSSPISLPEVDRPSGAAH